MDSYFYQTFLYYIRNDTILHMLSRTLVIRNGSMAVE